MSEHKKFIWVALGAAAALLFNATIAGVVNPILATFKINYV